MQSFPRRALKRYGLSVCPSICLVPTVNSKTANHTTFKRTEEVIHVRSNWQSSVQVKRSRSLEAEKRGLHIASASGTTLTCLMQL